MARLCVCCGIVAAKGGKGGGGGLRTCVNRLIYLRRWILVRRPARRPSRSGATLRGTLWRDVDSCPRCGTRWCWWPRTRSPRSPNGRPLSDYREKTRYIFMLARFFGAPSSSVCRYSIYGDNVCYVHICGGELYCSWCFLGKPIIKEQMCIFRRAEFN